MTGARPDGIERFVRAQAPCFDTVLAELARGRKETHWMWFVFPQLRGLGTSERARFYGLDGAGEAETYAAHPILAPRLRAASELVLSHAGVLSAGEILGAVDALKLRSCATLFAHVAPEARVFRALLDAFYEGAGCAQTKDRLTP
ncbi:MAG: DUF1810 domain-containing protein [Pseudomonadota bacterium]